MFSNIQNLELRTELSRIINCIIQSYKPKLIVLFGSYGRGNFSKHSDLDLLIVKNTNKRPIWRRVEIRKIINTNLPVDIVVYTPKEYIELKKSGSAFIKEILEKGKILYEE